MSGFPLFGNTSVQGGSSGGNQHLVEFRAGRMTMKGRMVHPDKRKGLLYVYQGQDYIMHLCWQDRTTGEVEDDLQIYPDDCEFVRVNECTTGRVYVLKYKYFSKKYFFWMQEPKTDKDDDLCRRINLALNYPPISGGSEARDRELQNILNHMSYQQLMQLFILGTMGWAFDRDLSSEAREREMQNLLNNMSHQQLMQLFILGTMGSALGPDLGSESQGRELQNRLNTMSHQQLMQLFLLGTMGWALGPELSCEGEAIELQNILNNMSHQQIIQLFFLGTMGDNSSSDNTSSRPSADNGNCFRETPAIAPAPAPAPTVTPPNTPIATEPLSGQIFLPDLQCSFPELGMAPPESECAEAGAVAGAVAGAEAGAVAGAEASCIELAVVLISLDMLSKATLPPPPPPPPPADAAAQDDAANQFSSALTSEEMGSGISHLGLLAEVAAVANSGNVQALFKALGNTVNPAGGEKPEGGQAEVDDKKKDEMKEKDKDDDKKEGDDAMSLD